MKPKLENALKAYLIELLIYAVLVAGYFFLVLHFLGHWLNQLFRTERWAYAFVALGLILGQGFLLEALTRVLVGWIKGRSEAE